MPSIFIIKDKMKNPKEWYDKVMGNQQEWEYDENINQSRAGNVYLVEREDSVAFEDVSDMEFYGWGTESWVKLAAGKELIYGYYSEDMLEAEFVHIKDGKCIRDYRVYDSEVDTDEGDEPEFESWVDVASYVDRHML